MKFFVHAKTLNNNLQDIGMLFSDYPDSGHLLLEALQLSVADNTKDSSSQSDMSKLLADQSFVSSILASVCLNLINPVIIHFSNGRLIE